MATKTKNLNVEIQRNASDIESLFKRDSLGYGKVNADCEMPSGETFGVYIAEKLQARDGVLRDVILNAFAFKNAEGDWKKSLEVASERYAGPTIACIKTAVGLLDHAHDAKIHLAKVRDLYGLRELSVEIKNALKDKDENTLQTLRDSLKKGESPRKVKAKLKGEDATEEKAAAVVNDSDVVVSPTESVDVARQVALNKIEKLRDMTIDEKSGFVRHALSILGLSKEYTLCSNTYLDSLKSVKAKK